VSQFTAILVDALRLLRAKALFWITFGISMFAAILYLSIGFDDQGVTLFFGLSSLENEVIRAGSPFAEMFYLGIFSLVIVNLWLSWIAVILALITCAPIFPAFMTEGSAGAVLCKPISRLKLFFYKYLSGLLFALLQTGLFCVIVFLAIRMRVGTWNPSVFWAVPLVVLMFSYLWSVMVVVGVRTRSTMASVLAALFVWFGAWLAKSAEEYIWTAAELGVMPGSNMPLSEKEQQRWSERYATFSIPYKLLPKTTDTVGLLNRMIVVEGDREFSMTEVLTAMSGEAPRRDPEIEEGLRRHSTVYIIGSSLAFEALLVGFAAWSFCSRDF
jgi:ABC-type transport system involved in multi-copper enzyme maturation permease subunit